MTNARLSTTTRQPKNIQFQVTERDILILEALKRYRYLKTSQISRLIFPENKTIQSTRRRLKYLFHAGMIGRLQPFIQVGKSSGETAYYLEKKAWDFIEDGGSTPRYGKVKNVKPQFLEHALAVSEFRLNLESACKVNEVVELHRFVADFELKENFENLAGKHRYRLFDEVNDPISKQTHIVYPDALFILRGKGKKYQQFQRLFFVEIDRGTEGLRVVQDKLTGYHLYKREEIFKKYGQFDDFRVLFQVPSEKRLENIVDLTENFASELSIWSTLGNMASGSDLLGDPIWYNQNADRISILSASI